MLVLLTFAGLTPTRAQYMDMDLNFELKEGAEINVKSSLNRQWIEIRVSENLGLEIDISYIKLPEGERYLPAEYLNNGTSDISEAVRFPGRRATFLVNNSGGLLKNVRHPAQNMSVWIGVPPGQVRELMIIYN